MSLEDVFPEDPCIPSLKYAAYSRAPVSVPWSRRQVKLGAGFRALDGRDDDPISKTSAFNEADCKDANIDYRTHSNFSINELSNSNTLDEYSHMDLAIGASVGCSWAGASGRGTWNDAARNSGRTAQASSRAEATIGSFSLRRYPGLSQEALRILRSAQDPEAEFKREYGDYFVAGMTVGATNSTLLGGQFMDALKTKDVVVDVTGRFLFVKGTKHYEDHQRDGKTQGLMSLTSFDSLETSAQRNESANSLDYVDSLRLEAVANRNRGSNLFQRAHEAVRKWDLSQPSVALLTSLSGEGLISGLQLVPYSFLRDYTTAMLYRSNMR